MARDKRRWRTHLKSDKDYVFRLLTTTTVEIVGVLLIVFFSTTK